MWPVICMASGSVICRAIELASSACCILSFLLTAGLTLGGATLIVAPALINVPVADKDGRRLAPHQA